MTPIKIATNMKAEQESLERIAERLGPSTLLDSVPRKIKEGYLTRVQEKIDHYKPMIEAKTGIKLGDVRARDFRDMSNDTMLRDISEAMINHGFEAIYSPVFRIKHAIKKMCVKSSATLNYLLGTNEDSYMCADNCMVYVPFNYDRQKDFSEKDFSVDDSIVVHELSHILWEKIEKEKGPFRLHLKDFRLWAEGFATYCELNYFRDLYPNGTKIKKPTALTGIYKKGIQKIEETVNRYGQGILLEIPKKWKELGKEFLPPIQFFIEAYKSLAHKKHKAVA